MLWGWNLPTQAFHHTALSEFHTRLITGNAEFLLLDTPTRDHQ
jgi:hypothetical protein